MLHEPWTTEEELLEAAFGNDELAGLAAIRLLRHDLLQREQQLVISARLRRHTWAEIGVALATSRQGAFNRFGEMVNRFEQTGALEPNADTDQADSGLLGDSGR
ncbi:MAG: hypothetical protein ACRD12_06815 [Acidimicrobiales bacterium]